MAAEEVSGTEPTFTLNDFPTELIERFAPDLRPRTVSTLRLVSPRLRDVFISDRYYKSYLCYGNRLEFYRQDLEEIGEARDRWWRCLEAEKQRLDNWRHGRPKRVESVRVPSDMVSPYMLLGNGGIEWQGMVGEGNNYWIICELKNQKVLLANVSGHPIVTVVDVSRHTSRKFKFSQLLADQVVIVGTDNSIQIFNILNDGNALALEHFFTIEAGLATGVDVSGMSSLTHSYRNLYISPIETGVLRVWDLKRAVELDILDLNDLLPPNCVAEFGEPYHVITLKKTEFPYVLVSIEARWKPILYLAVNVEERCIACCIAREVDLDLHQWFIKERQLFMKYYIMETFETDIRIYNLEPQSHPCSRPQPFFRQISQNQESLPTITYYEPPFLLENNEKKVIVTRIDEPGSQSEINCGLGFDSICVLGPFLVTDQHLFFRNSCNLLTWEAKDKLLFDFKEVLEAKVGEVNDICLLYFASEFCPLFHSLSTFVVQSRFGDTLYICHF